MSTFTRTITPTGTGSDIGFLPLMQPGTGNAMTVTVNTVGGGTETLAAAVYHCTFSGGVLTVGALLLRQGPTGGVNSITVSPNASDNGFYIAAYRVSSLSPNITVIISSPTGTIKGLGSTKRSGIIVVGIGSVKRSGALVEGLFETSRTGALVLSST